MSLFIGFYSKCKCMDIYMKMNYIPIILVVISSSFYHLFQKSIPSVINPIVTIIVAYFSALVVSIISFFVFVPKTNLIQSLRAANWASILLGLAAVGIELGFLLSYRMGWNISAAGLLSNTLVALVLIPIGVLIFKETISFTSISGVLLCIIGLILVSRR